MGIKIIVVTPSGRASRVPDNIDPMIMVEIALDAVRIAYPAALGQFLVLILFHAATSQTVIANPVVNPRIRIARFSTLIPQISKESSHLVSYRIQPSVDWQFLAEP